MSASADGGIRFGQYVLLRRIARGGMAEVFLAQQKGLEGFDRRVAVKRILPHLADAPDFVKMFLGEARLAAQLTHPNVVHIYDFGKVDTDYFIAMEFVDGVHCGQLFKYGERERLSPTMIARIGADAAAALHYAHELRNSSGKAYGLVHRDVSPANIMVSYDGVVKLCDFGIAKAAALGDQLTNPGQVKGKYAYMSPEQTIAAPLDGRSDVFSLAIVLWELLAGKTIVGRGDAVDAMRAIRDGKLAPITQAAPRTPPQLAKAIVWAMQTRREARATAMDFAQALEAFIKSSPELATSLQLGGWVKQRFPREGTGEHRALLPGVSMGTRPAQATLAVPETMDGGTAVHTGTRAAEDTPPRGTTTLGNSTMSGDDLLESAETVSLDSEEARGLTTLDDHRERPPLPRPRAAPSQRVTVPRTAADDPNVRAANETTLRAGTGVLVADGPPPIPATPTVIDTRPPTHAPSVDRSGERRRQQVETTGRLPRQNRARMALAIAGLAGLAVISFLIALAARGGSHAAAPPDAAVALSLPPPPAIDAAVDAPPPVDAPELDAFEPTIRADAMEQPTYLEIRTVPGGGTVTINGEKREEPAKFALDAGHYEITAELEGYAPERRAIDLEQGFDRVQEIAFRKKLSGPARVEKKPGKLSVRTTPYSIVYVGGKKLGEAPFAEMEMAAGTYTLTFKNPEHQPVTRTVTIAPGKTTKLSVVIP